MDIDGKHTWEEGQIRVSAVLTGSTAGLEISPPQHLWGLLGKQWREMIQGGAKDTNGWDPRKTFIIVFVFWFVPLSLGWEDLLEKEMATHSSILAWKIPWTEEPGRLRSMGSQRVGHNWVTSLSLWLFLKFLYSLLLWLLFFFFNLNLFILIGG